MAAGPAGNLSLVVDRILRLFGSEEKKKENKSLLQGLEETISTLKSVLLDAEKKSQRDKRVGDWLVELEDVLYDAENLLDDLFTQEFRPVSMNRGNKMAKQVRTDLLSSKLKNTRGEVKQVKNRLDKIKDRITVLNLRVLTAGSESVANLDEGTIRSNIKHGSSKLLFGSDIIQRCARHPLVISAVASLLPSESIEQWPSFYKNEITKIGNSHDRFPSGLSYSSDLQVIMPLLKLCYDHLPLHLKHCFAYCSLFPKDHEIDVQTLVKLWMAQGFIIEQSGKSLDDVGYDYFRILLERCFFQKVETNTTERVTKCKMHNVMHDLAMFVAGDRCRLLSSSDDVISNGQTFHVWFDFDISSTKDIATFDAKKMRSIFSSGQSRRRYRGMPVNTIFDQITSRFRFLRALDMHASGIEMVPKSIGKLKLLKYLDLSENEDITELPNSITELVNLQTLRLSWCLKLKKLPRDLRKLVNLLHLEIDGCNNLTSLSEGIHQPQNLKELSQLVVSEDSSKPEVLINELRGRDNLIEKFQISNLRLILRHEKNVTKYLENVPSQIQSLSLEWEGHALESEYEQTPLIGNLSSDVKELSINGFRRVT